MYGDEVFTRKSSHAGVISQTRNYVMYEDVDELEKFRKKRPVLHERRPEPFYDPLDNYRYYEDLKLKDKRKRSLVKHERTSEPVGRETPFLRDSFKKHVVNYVPSSNTQRSYSNERSNRRQSPRPELRQRDKDQDQEQDMNIDKVQDKAQDQDLSPIKTIIIRIILHFSLNQKVVLEKPILSLDNFVLVPKEVKIISILEIPK